MAGSGDYDVSPLFAAVLTPSDRKRTTRQKVLARRDALTVDERAAASAIIATRAAPLIKTDTVALYASMATEVDTGPLDALLRARGTRVVYPRIVHGDRRLTFHVAASVEALVPTGRLKIREPIGDEVALDQIGTFVIPGIAFDSWGGRVGWGRGHYDATLAGAPGAARIGLAFACQMVDAIPEESHDLAMNFVVTEQYTHGLQIS